MQATLTQRTTVSQPYLHPHELSRRGCKGMEAVNNVSAKICELTAPLQVPVPLDLVAVKVNT